MLSVEQWWLVGESVEVVEWLQTGVRGSDEVDNTRYWRMGLVLLELGLLSTWEGHLRSAF